MSGRTRERPRIDHLDAPLQETVEEQQSPLQFASLQQFAILQDKMSTIIDTLQRMTAPPPTTEIPPTAGIPPTAEVPSVAKIPPTVEIPPAVEIPPSETTQTHEMTSTSRCSIPTNWESILNEKFDEAIARRKNRGQPIT
ncbi:hypothetical protein Fot_42838 [Forsythia ovata]|uniref:Uncharacterized protein n=1 Tax=Forsythia ovata TaxID=205694 RepID=A0ABD1RMB0_9LAMI